MLPNTDNKDRKEYKISWESGEIYGYSNVTIFIKKSLWVFTYWKKIWYVNNIPSYETQNNYKEEDYSFENEMKHYKSACKVVYDNMDWIV